MPQEPLDGLDAFTASSGPIGVLLLHGFTGSPRSLRPLAEVFADAGYAVELPVLPGHGSTVEALAKTCFGDWVAFAAETFSSLAARTDRVVVVGHSMGGALALELALSQLEVTGLVLINPLVAPAAPSFLELLQGALSQGVFTIPTIGQDVRREGVRTGGYEATPIEPLLSLLAAIEPLSSRLSEVVCPTLLFSSRVDHVVPPESSDLVEARLGGPVERVILEHSYHVATLDDDAEEIEERSVTFVAKLCAA